MILTLLLLSAPPAECASQIHVNGECVSVALIERLEQAYGVKSVPGRYWYDARAGLLGREGEGTLSLTAPNLPLPGKLSPRASGGGTNVFINGRELHPLEVAFLSQLGPVLPGRYWLDSTGNVGVDGSPLPFANLAALYQSKLAPRAKDNYHGNSKLGTYSNSENGCSYVQTPSGSVTVGCD